jgi:L-cystine uptake protein TcyP (sodium:dicarboxylate symporter family)
MATKAATTDYQSIINLAKFVLCSYTAIIVMFIVHGIILGVMGINPITYFRKAGSAILFAFSSRSSMATLPLTTSTLTDTMGVQGGISNMAATLGTSIGQNGCAGIYPAMLVCMVMGDRMTPGFFALMVVVIVFASIGIAGVGGGATFAGITVLSALGLPVDIAGLLIGIEPLIDMARTALNVSDGMLSALFTAKVTGNWDKAVYTNTRTQLSARAQAMVAAKK